MALFLLAAFTTCPGFGPGAASAAEGGGPPAAASSAFGGGVADPRIDALRQQIAAQPGSDLYLRLGRLLMEKEAFAESLAAYDEALRLRPHSHAAKTGKGAVLSRQGRFAEAEALLRDALVLNPDPVEAHYELGLLYSRQGDLARAIEEYKKGLGKFHEGRR